MLWHAGYESLRTGRQPDAVRRLQHANQHGHVYRPGRQDQVEQAKANTASHRIQHQVRTSSHARRIHWPPTAHLVGVLCHSNLEHTDGRTKEDTRDRQKAKVFNRMEYVSTELHIHYMAVQRAKET